jgi:hypothetical protein
LNLLVIFEVLVAVRMKDAGFINLYRKQLCRRFIGVTRPNMSLVDNVI